MMRISRASAIGLASLVLAGTSWAQDMDGIYTGDYNVSGPCTVPDFLVLSDSGPATLHVSNSNNPPTANVTIRWEGTKRKSFGCEVVGDTLVCDGMWGDDFDGDPIPFTLEFGGGSASGSSGPHICGLGETRISFNFVKDEAPPDDDDDPDDDSEDEYFWSVGDGAYGTAGNWEPEGPPDENDVINFDREQNSEVSVPASQTCGLMRVVRGDVTFSGGSLTATGPTLPTLVIATVPDAAAALSLANHALRTSSMAIGAAGSLGVLLISEGASVDVTNEVALAPVGSAEMLARGGRLSCSLLQCAPPTQERGHVRFEGTAAHLQTGELLFDGAGTASLEVADGARAEVTGGNATFAFVEPGDASLLVSGSSQGLPSVLDLDGGALQLGGFGRAQARVDAGAELRAGGITVAGPPGPGLQSSTFYLLGKQSDELTTAAYADAFIDVEGVAVVSRHAELSSQTGRVASAGAGGAQSGIISIQGSWVLTDALQVGDAVGDEDVAGTLDVRGDVFTPRLTVFPQGIVTGTGFVTASVMNVQGTIRTGVNTIVTPSKAGKLAQQGLELIGNLTMQGGRVVIEATGPEPTDIASLSIVGDAAFENTEFVLQLADGYAPTAGTELSFLNATGTLTLDGVTTSYAGAAEGFAFEIDAAQAAVSARVLNDAVATTSPFDAYDVDGNRSVDAVDLQFVVRAALGLFAGTTVVDVNGDGAVDAVDLQLVVRAVLGLV